MLLIAWENGGLQQPLIQFISLGMMIPMWCTMYLVIFLVTSVDNKGSLGLLNLVSRPLSSRYGTWMEFIRHGGVEVVRYFERFLVVFHAFRLLCVRSVFVMTSSLPSFSKPALFQSLWLCCQMDCLNTVSCILYRNFTHKPGLHCSLHPLGIWFLDVTHINSMNR